MARGEVVDAGKLKLAKTCTFQKLFYSMIKKSGYGEKTHFPRVINTAAAPGRDVNTVDVLARHHRISWQTGIFA